MSLHQRCQPVTDEQVAFYRENGYVAIENVLTTAELTSIRAAMSEVIEQGTMEGVARKEGDSAKAGKVFLQRINLWRVHDGIRDHTLNPKLGEIARRLAGVERMRVFHDHMLTKMPGDSRPTNWHQDAPYWPMEKAERTISCWMALDDVTEENGCMWFVPRSHGFQVREVIHILEEDHEDIFERIPEADRRGIRKVPVHLRAGSCTFHNGYTFHYAGSNRSKAPRRAMVTIYMPDGTRYNGNGHCVTDPLGLKKGADLSGEVFPLVAPDQGRRPSRNV